MGLRRSIHVALVLAVIASAIATHAVGPRIAADTPCGMHNVTLAVEVCPRTDVQKILEAGGPAMRVQLRDQTLVDFALIASYVGLWGATGAALHPAVAGTAVLAGVADAIENLALLHELGQSAPIPAVRVAARVKWALLGLVFVAFAVLLRPDGVSGGWRALVRTATGVAYGLAGIAALVGAVRVPTIEWVVPPLVAAVLLQLLLHLVAHGAFVTSVARGRAAIRSTAPSLSLAQVFGEEFERLHGPLPDAARTGGLPGLFDAIHALGDRRTALCLSGGGIRSATFALGVLQGLAKHRVLSQFHYLSTVSGGGYIGAWLTAWLHRSGDDVEQVSRGLASISSARKLSPEAEPIAHLRDYSNYLAPRGGLLSADTWTLLGTVLRNLILLWAVLIPLLAAGLIVPRLYLALLFAAPDAALQHAIGGRLLLGAGALALAWAVAYIGASIPSSTTIPRGQGRFLWSCIGPLLIAIFCLTLYWAWWPVRAAWPFVLFAVIVHLVAWAGYTAYLLSPWGGARPKKNGHPIAASLVELLVVVVAGAAAGYLASVLAGLFFPDPARFALLYACLAPGVFLSAFLLAATLLVGFISRWTEDEDREWWARSGAWMLIVGTVWLVGSTLVLFGPLLLSGAVARWLLGAVGGVSGLITVLGGWSARSAATKEAAGGGLGALLGRLTLPAAAGVLAAVLVLAVSWLTSAGLARVTPLLAVGPPPDLPPQWPLLGAALSGHVRALLGTPSWLVLAAAVALALLGGLVALLVNTNRFSLHAMYRARLIRAYLGASNGIGRAGGGPAEREHRNPFTGFDETDNIGMRELWPNPRREDARVPRKAAPAAAPRRALFHVVNMALNLVQGDRLAWQERKAQSFTVTPLHAGSLAAGADDHFERAVTVGGYRRTQSEPDGPHSRYGDGISLGTAITISGAAASPNMGYNSSPLVTFMMTFFNARLGWWLGNPGPAGDDTFYLSSPRLTIRPIVAEAFGLTGRTAPYVYLSDGGHFDNLGLYEMVLRRCHLILVSDGGCDPGCDLNDLGGAVRKIRADFGIPIDFADPIPIFSRAATPEQCAHGLYWWVGRIRYSVVDPPAPGAAPDANDGFLLYVKPAYYGTEPPDVYEYARANATFPHESTVDQFFTESQFESYRMLGAHAIDRLTDAWGGGSLRELIDYARRRPAAP